MGATIASHLRRGLDFERAGHYRDAATAYREAIAADPGAVEARVRLGVVLRELGLDEEANGTFLSALDVARGPDPA